MGVVQQAVDGLVAAEIDDREDVSGRNDGRPRGAGGHEVVADDGARGERADGHGQSPRATAYSRVAANARSCSGEAVHHGSDAAVGAPRQASTSSAVQV